MRSTFALVLVGSSLLVAVRAASATNSWWNAGSGLLPDSPCWTLVDSSPLADPALASGRMSLSTNTPVEYMYFEQGGAQPSVPGTWTIEAGVRVVTESHPAGSARWGAAIGFASAPGRGSVLCIGAGELMLWAGFGAAGPTAALPTTDRVHDYRIEVEAAGTVRVYQDERLVLSGSTIAHVGFGSEPCLYFGDGSGEGASVTEWTHLRHDGAASSCGTTVGAPPRMAVPSIGLERPAPNPTARDVELRFDLPRPASIQLAIFDGSGRRVRSLASGVHPPGSHPIRWDLRDDRGARIPPGLCFARLEADGGRFVRPIAVTR